MPEDLAAVARVALAVDPRARFPSVETMRGWIERGAVAGASELGAWVADALTASRA
jgi:hypothetical protein